MPEISEVRIMSDFINDKSHSKKFDKAFHVAKGNIPSMFINNDFTVNSSSRGKELYLNLGNTLIYVFMGMNGNWKYVSTQDWNTTKYVRLRLDDTTGHSLILYGGYMGPKYSVNRPFTGTKRGPDPVKDFDNFKKNITQNISRPTFTKNLCEVLLNQEYFNGIGAYLTSEIIGRSGLNPFLNFNSLTKNEIDNLLDLVNVCCKESYKFGGGELRDWHNPFEKSRIDEWLEFYGNKINCHKHKFGSRNIWIPNKFKKEKSQ